MINKNLGNYYETKENILYKKRHIDKYVSFDDFFDINFLIDKIFSPCSKNTRYSVIVRVCYSNSSSDITTDITTEWKSLGEQIPLLFNGSETFENIITSFQKTVIHRIRYSMEFYGKDEDSILLFQILIFNVNFTDLVVKKKNLFNTKTLGPNKDLLNVSKISKGLNTVIPLTMDTKYFGILLDKIVMDNKLFIKLVDGTTVDFLDRVNNYSKNKIDSFPNNLVFYQNIKSDVIITVDSNIDNIITVYTINGMKIYDMVDSKLSHSNNFQRKFGNVVVSINEKGIYNKEIKMNLEAVYPKKVSGIQARMLHPDWMVGTMDIETFKDIDNLSKPYAAGFYTNNELKTFYIDKDFNFDSVILNCIDSMLVEKYNNYVFYIHNLGRFDIVFILKAIIKANTIDQDKYNYNLIFRDDLILSIEISSKIKGKNYTIKLADSYNLLNTSLIKLCNTFDTEVKKTFFPYDFINRKNLFYTGKKPAIEYFNDLDKTIYKSISKIWSTKDETLKYLNNDLISLYSVIDKFKSQIYINYKTHITKSLTISGLAMQIYLKEYYSNNIPLINKTSLYNNIKKSYFGGITEVYKPHGKDLYYYDVNSLYPYSALNAMPGLDCSFIDIINKNITECLQEDFFGFYYCEIETSDKYIGLLPVRTETGLIMPLGIIKGWFFSEELKFAYENGYNIHVVNGYKFSKNYKVFDKYVEEFYKIKSETKDPVMKAISKSLLNNLLGRFGLNIEKSITELLTEDQYEELLQHKKIKGVKFIEDKFLVTYDTDVSAEICDLHDVDYKETLLNVTKNPNKNNKIFKQNTHHDVSIAISSSITSYSRIYMNKIKLDILSKGGHIYYTDTDSIVTNIKLDDKFVGLELGQFKLEHEIEEAYFISTKTYVFKNKKGEFILKAKGVNDSNLSFNDFKDMYLGKNIKTVRRETIRDFSNGSVDINVTRNIVLSGNVYNKRTKIYQNSMWTDTKPLIQSKYYSSKNINSDTVYNNFVSCILFALCILFLFIKIIYNIIDLGTEIDILSSGDIRISDFVDTDNKVNTKNTINIFEKYNFVDYDNRLDDLYKKSELNISKPIKSEILDIIKQKHMEDNIKNLEFYRTQYNSLNLEIQMLREECERLYSINNDALKIISNRNSV